MNSSKPGRRRSDVLTILDSISTGLARHGSGGQKTLEQIVDSVRSLLPGASAAIYVRGEERLELAAGGQAPHVATDDGELWTLASDLHRTSAAVRTSRRVCLSITVAGEASGILDVCLHDAPLNKAGLLALRNVASLAGIAIANGQQADTIRRDLARKEDELGKLRRAGLLISSRTGLKETLDGILSMAFEVTGAKYGILRLVDRDGRELVTHAVAGQNLGRPLIEALPVNATSITGLVAKSRQPLCIADVQDDPWASIYYPLDGDLEMRSELAAPLLGAGGRLEGVLNLESPAIGAFDEQDSHLLQALATQAVIAIQDARLIDAVQDVAERLMTQPCQQILDHLVALACHLLNTADSSLWIREGDSLSLRAATASHEHPQTLPIAGTLIGRSILMRSIVTSADVRTERRFSLRAQARARGWTWAIIVPLLAHDSEPIGAFTVYGRDGDPGLAAAADWDAKVLTILGRYAALAVTNAASQSALRLAQERRAAAETFAAVGDVAANLMHNLNNKLGAIPPRIEGIEDKSATTLQHDDYLANHLREIGRSVRESLDIVRDSLAHLQSAPLAAVSLHECLSEALANTLPPAIQVEVAGMADLPPVRAGKRALSLAFANLLENAADAMGTEGAIRIAGLAGPECVVVTIADDGPGIPPDLHERIFELHFSRTQTARPNKLGFGLWWVRMLMMRLGGSIRVQSDGEHGATFILTLPREESSV